MTNTIAVKKDTRFKKGEVNNPRGRKKGVGNRITTRTKEAFDLVFDRVDCQEYLEYLMFDEPALFVSLWRHLLPKDVKLESNVNAISKIAHVIIDVTDIQDTGGQGGGYP